MSARSDTPHASMVGRISTAPQIAPRSRGEWTSHRLDTPYSWYWLYLPFARCVPTGNDGSFFLMRSPLAISCSVSVNL